MKRIVLLAVLLAVSGGMASAASVDLTSLDWSVQYIIDQSQTVLGVDQFDRPRNNRGLAASPDGNYLYAGYNNPSDGYEVRKIDLNETDYTAATVARLPGYRGKGIEVDDQGRVYLAEGSGNNRYISIRSSDLATEQLSVYHYKCEGVVTARESGQLVMYASDRSNGTVTRYLMSESGGTVTGASIDTGWGTNGAITLSADLRGMDIDDSGRIWVADNDSASVYVVASDGSSYQTVGGLNNAMDVAIFEDVALVSREYDLLISQIDTASLTSAGADIAIPLGDLNLTGSPATGGPASYDQMALIPGKGLFVAGDGVNTANEHSTYGAIDEESGYIGDTFYTDMTHDDNDPILFGVIPEPTSLALLGLGGLALLRRRRS